MNNKHFNYKSSNNKRLITTASIALVLFNVQPAKADDNDEFEEINDIEQKQEEVVTNPQRTEEKTDDEISIASEEIIEYIISLLDIEQTELFNEFLSEENKSTEQLTQALESHATNDFVLAGDQYQATIENLSENTSSFIIKIIEVLQEAAEEERNIFDVKALIIESEESEQETEEENIDEENTQEENHQEVEETTNENSQQKEISNVQSGERTPEDFKEEIIKSKSVSDAWNLAQEFKRKYPNHEFLEEAINHAAKMNLDYGIKLHNRREYKNSIAYYERVINESLIQESLKNEARAYLKQASINKDMLTPEDYYNEILSEKSTSIAWNLAKEFKVVYPENSLLNEAMNHAAQMNLDYGIKVHKRGEYKNAASYYSRIIDEEKVSTTLKKNAQGYLNQANANRKLMTPKDYYNKILKEKSVSEAWNLAQEFKVNFSNDVLLKEAMNHAAQMNLDYGMKVHKRGEYKNAASYYNRIINEKNISSTIKSTAQVYLNQAEENNKLTTPNDYYKKILKEKSTSEAWNLAQEFKTNFPGDIFLGEAMNHVAQMSLDYGMKVHKRGEYKNAASYYNRVVNEDKVSTTLKNIAQGYLKQAKENKKLVTSNDYYKKILKEKSTSGAWNLAQEFKVYFPNDTLLEEAMKHAAQMNLDYGMKVHKRGEYKNAASYYNRIINEEKVSATLKKTVQGYLNQANTNSRLMTPKDYYNKILKEKSVSGAWNSAQEFKANFPDDALLKSAMNHAAQMNLDYAIKLHKNSEFSAASSYYERLINEKHTPFSIKNKAELYNYLAISNLHIGESIVNTSKYNTSLSQAINKQLSVKAQTSKEGGGFRDATKDEVAHYINPNNFLPSDSTSLIEALSTVQITTDVLNVRTGPSTMHKQIGTVKKGEVFTIIDISDGWYKISINGETGWISGNKSYVYKNNEILQFLDLSKSMGIPTSELNKYLKGNGILDGTGEAFSKASQQAKINELYLISHALLETGNGKSKLATGILVSEVNGKKVTPKIVYNMFGIGAVDSNPEKYGAERAYQEGWFTPEAAIIGGAKWVGQNYIHNSQHKQNTLYKMRWNPSKPGTHQYATDIGWATKQTNLIISEAPLLAQKYDLVLVFDIPEYQK